jgi:hypothetical protein
MSRRQAAGGETQRGGLYEPRPVRVRLEGVVPAWVGGRKVESIREEWLVEDRWWSPSPLRRHYVELVLETGRCLVAFRDLETGRWFEQR